MGLVNLLQGNSGCTARSAHASSWAEGKVSRCCFQGVGAVYGLTGCILGTVHMAPKRWRSCSQPPAGCHATAALSAHYPGSWAARSGGAVKKGPAGRTSGWLSARIGTAQRWRAREGGAELCAPQLSGDLLKARPVKLVLSPATPAVTKWKPRCGMENTQLSTVRLRHAGVVQQGHILLRAGAPRMDAAVGSHYAACQGLRGAAPAGRSAARTS